MWQFGMILLSNINIAVMSNNWYLLILLTVNKQTHNADSAFLLQLHTPIAASLPHAIANIIRPKTHNQQYDGNQTDILKMTKMGRYQC